MCPRKPWDIPGCRGNPGILSIQGHACAPGSLGISRDVQGIPGYFVFRDKHVPQVALGYPGMSRESRDT